MKTTYEYFQLVKNIYLDNFPLKYGVTQEEPAQNIKN